MTGEPMSRFEGIVISGASRGLGAALARSLAGPGVRMLLVARSAEALEKVAAECAARGARPRIAALDVRDASALAAALAEFEAEGPVDLVVANAGTSAGTGADGAPEAVAEAARQVEVNLLGALHLVGPLLPGMRARGRGTVGLIASVAAFRGLPDCPGYCASKAGLLAWGEALRAAHGPCGIIVSVICPGFFDSAMGDRFLGHAERCASILHLIDGTGDNVAKTYKTIRGELEAYGHGLEDKNEIVALNKVDAIPEKDLAKKRAALEKACGHKVHVISGVSGEGIPTVLRAMAREITQRRLHRAERAAFARPAAVPRTRSERQSANFNAPVVPKERLQDTIRSAKPVTAAKPAAKVVAPPKAAKAEKKAKPTRKYGNARPKKAVKTVKAKVRTGKAKAKPRNLSKTKQRAAKSGQKKRR